MTCASCGTELERRDGPGRPSVYCGEPCRRMAEFRIRALVRRIDAHENLKRDLEAGDVGERHYLEDYQRAKLLRLAKKWLAEDQAKLRALLGVKPEDDVPTKGAPR